MNKYSFFYAITIALLVPLAHAMEKQEPINPNSFDQNGKDYMDYAVGIWVQAAQEGKITTGLANVFNTIKKVGINDLIHDQIALEKANDGLEAMLKDPVFKNFIRFTKNWHIYLFWFKTIACRCFSCGYTSSCYECYGNGVS